MHVPCCSDVKPDNILIDFRWSSLRGPGDGAAATGCSSGGAGKRRPAFSLSASSLLPPPPHDEALGPTSTASTPSVGPSPTDVLRHQDAINSARLVLCDFGECLDCAREGIENFRMQYLYSTMGKGGAPAFYAPEVSAARPGRDAVIDFSAQDAWALGMVLWSMLTPHPPFKANQPSGRSGPDEQGAQLRVVPSASAVVRRMVSGLLCVNPELRLTAEDVVAMAEIALFIPRPGAGRSWTQPYVEQQLHSLRERMCSRLPLDVHDASVTVTESLLLTFLASDRAQSQQVLATTSRLFLA